MSDVVVRVENLSKHYRLGQIGGGTLREDLHSWWASVRGQDDPLQKVDGQPRVTSGEHWALKDVSFDVRQGEVLGIIGRNGAGKSTLLKILSRTTAPTRGSVRIKGRVGSLLEVGTGFHPELSGRENIYLNGVILGMRKSEIDRKIDEIIDFSGVEKFIDTPVKRYSSGMYVRLAFAVAAHLEPEILIVDEVLAVGDIEFQKKCLGKMQDVSKQGRSVIFVSHNMAAILALCPQSIYLNAGRLINRAPSRELIATFIKSLATKNNLPKKCGSNLTIQALSLATNPTICNSNANIVLSIRAAESDTISDVALLIYSDKGDRVAVLDLKQEGGRFDINADSVLNLHVAIAKLNIVEGTYTLGLYISSRYFDADELDIAEFSVISMERTYATYASAVRGIVELDYSVKLEN